MVETGYDVAGGGGELGEEEVARGGGAVERAARCAYYDLEGTGVDVCASCPWDEVEAAGVGVSDCGLRRWIY